MPQKLNSAGKMQNYVPAGNGDASGEYGDNATGSNKHFKVFKKPDQKETTQEEFDKFDEKELDNNINVSEKARDNLINHLSNKSDENNKTLNEVIDNTTELGHVVLNNF